MAHGAIYLETLQPDIAALGDGVIFTSASGGADAKYEFTVGETPVILNVMPSDQIPGHLRGFCGYVQQLRDPEPQRQDAIERISRIRHVLGLVTEPEFDQVPVLWSRLCELTRINGGLVFTFNSIYLSDGTVLVGPMRD